MRNKHLLVGHAVQLCDCGVQANVWQQPSTLRLAHGRGHDKRFIFHLGVIGLAVKKTKMWLLPRAVRIYIYHRILSLKLCVKLCVLVCHQNLLVAGGFGDHALVLLGDLLDVTDHVEGVCVEKIAFA